MTVLALICLILYPLQICSILNMLRSQRSNKDRLMKIPLTHEFLETVSPPDRSRRYIEYFDTTGDGFAFYISYTGFTSFHGTYRVAAGPHRGEQRRLQLGRYPD